jgi:ribosomal protein S27AE
MTSYPIPAPKTWEELRSGASDWLSEQWGPEWHKRKCPYCDNEAWILGDVLALQRALRWPTQSQGDVIPMLQVLCTRCGHSVLLNALSVFQPQQLEEQLRAQPPRREQRPTMY